MLHLFRIPPSRLFGGGAPTPRTAGETKPHRAPPPCLRMSWPTGGRRTASTAARTMRMRSRRLLVNWGRRHPGCDCGPAVGKRPGGSSLLATALSQRLHATPRGAASNPAEKMAAHRLHQALRSGRLALRLHRGPVRRAKREDFRARREPLPSDHQRPVRPSSHAGRRSRRRVPRPRRLLRRKAGCCSRGRSRSTRTTIIFTSSTWPAAACGS